MAYFFAAVSAIVTGGLAALGAQLLGVHHLGIVVAIAIIAGGAQLLGLTVWYLLRTRPKEVRRDEP